MRKWVIGIALTLFVVAGLPAFASATPEKGDPASAKATAGRPATQVVKVKKAKKNLKRHKKSHKKHSKKVKKAKKHVKKHVKRGHKKVGKKHLKKAQK